MLGSSIVCNILLCYLHDDDDAAAAAADDDSVECNMLEVLLDSLVVDWIGLDWIGLDWIGLDCVHVSMAVSGLFVTYCRCGNEKKHLLAEPLGAVLKELLAHSAYPRGFVSWDQSGTLSTKMLRSLRD